MRLVEYKINRQLWKKRIAKISRISSTSKATSSYTITTTYSEYAEYYFLFWHWELRVVIDDYKHYGELNGMLKMISLAII
jgi:hypothetical protein